MADDVLARATVAVSADVKDFDVAMGLLPTKSQKAIRKSIDAIREEMARVGGAMASATNLADIQKLSDYFGKLQANLDGVKKAAISQAASLGEVGNAAGMSGNKMQMFAQTLDDLQYVPEMGLRPILNNLIQISPALGVAGLVLQQFISHWDDLARVFGQGRVKSQAEEMEELGKKTEKTAAETERLLKYEERRKNLDAQRGPTDSKSQQTSSINDAIRNSREVAVRQAIDTIHGGAIKNSIDANVEDNLARARVKDQAAREFAASVNANPDATRRDRDEATGALGRAREAIEAAQKAWDTAYSEGRDKIQGNLAEDLKALKNFIKDAEEKRLLDKDAIERLKKAARTPDEVASEESDKYYDAQERDIASRNATLEEAERVRKRDEDMAADRYYADQDRDLGSRSAEQGESLRVERQNKDTAKVAPLEDKLIPGLLEKIARGEEVNQEKLRDAIEDKIAGLGIQDPASVAANLARKSIEDAQLQVANRRMAKGGTNEEAAAALFADRAKQVKAEADANRPSVGVTDIEGYHREAQDALLKMDRSDALTAETRRAADNAKDLATRMEELNRTMKDRKGVVLQ